MSALAATRFASSGRSMMRGTTMAARMPRIATTTRTSMRVKPFCLPGEGRGPISSFTLLPYQRIQLEDRQQDRQHDHEHHAAHGEDHRGLEERGEGLQARGDVVLLRARGALERLVEAPAGLAARDEVHHHRRKGPVACKARASGMPSRTPRAAVAS